MRHRMLVRVMVVILLMLLQPLQTRAVERAEVEETARLLAALLESGRDVIERKQSLIDDPHAGDKGLTPEVFEAELVREFRAKSGIDLTSLPTAPVSIVIPPLAKELLPALVQAGREVVRDAQVVINQRGIGYKNFIPATWGSQTSARFSKSAHIRLKQTALDARNPKNEPDEYEASVLKWLAARPRAEAYVSELTEEGQTLRVVMPIYYAKDCLACHGEPKGVLDISGYPREGHKEGDLAGAITVTAPLGNR